MIIESISLRSALETPASPFPGLRPFKETESLLFFGRDEQIEKLVVKLAEKRFLAVVGTSGSGKSSLVRAGLISALQSGMMVGASHKWRIAEMRPTNDPIGNLARALNSTAVFGSQGEESIATQNAVIEATLRLGSRGLVEVVRQNRMADNESLLVLVDQFEELFRFAREARKAKDNRFDNDAAAFVKLLLEAVKLDQQEANIFVVLTMRSDFLGDCSQFWDLPEAINESQYLIPRLTRDQLREVIEGPVAVGGGQIAPRLVNQLLNDIADNQDQLPILQHALMRTWGHWQEYGFVVPPSDGDASNPDRLKAELQTRVPIDLEHYESIGGMVEALSLHADDTLDMVGDDRHRLVAEKMFKALTEKGEDNRETRRPVEFGKLCAVAEASEEELKTVIETFREPSRSFLMPPAGTPLEETTLVDISHESLIRVWTRLQQWTNEEAESAALYRRLADATRRKAEPWRGKDLLEAESWLEKQALGPAWAERYDSIYIDAIGFLRASQDRREAELQRLEQQKREEAESTQRLEQARAVAAAQTLAAQAEKQRADDQAKSAARLRRLTGALIVVAVLAGAAAITALWNYRKANQEADQAKQINYVFNMNLAGNEFSRGNRQRVYELLKAYLPATTAAQKQEDRRSFYWYYLWFQNYPELGTLQGHGDSVWSVAFSPDGRTLASASSDKSVKLWDVQSRKELATLQGHGSAVWSVAFSPDGRTLASASSDNSVKLWDVQSRKELATLQGHGSAVPSVAFSPDGRTLASASSDKSVKLWDVQSRKELATLQGHGDSVLSVAFSPDGRTLASASSDKSVKLWDVQSRKELATLQGHGDSVLSVAFSPDGRTLASASYDKSVKLWDVQSRKELATLQGHGDSVLSVAFSPDGRTLASASYDKSVKLWDVQSRKELATLQGHGSAVRLVAFSPDGRSLASASSDKSVKLWDVQSRKELATLQGHGSAVPSVAFSPDGRTLASASSDKSVKLWDVQSRKELATLQGHGDSVLSVAFSPDGRTLASASDDNSVKLWDVQSRKELATLRGHRSSVSSVAFSPDGRTLASASSDKSVKLWDVQSRKELATLRGHGSYVWSVAFSPDGRTLASASNDKSVKLWDVQSRKELATLQGHGSAVWSVAFSPDGRTLASASSDNSVKLWDVQSRKELATLQGHGSAVPSVAFSPDGRTLASASSDKSVKLWDVQSRKELATLQGHGDSVLSVAFSPDGRTLASASSDNSVKLWRGATDEEIAQQGNR